MSMDMNDPIRRYGNRSRTLPNIGQNPGIRPQGTPPPIGQPPQMPGLNPQATPGMAPSAPATPGMGRPENPIQVHPPGQPAPVDHYNYEPQPNGAWTVYPPGVVAPPGNMHISTPRAASTNDYARIRNAMGTHQLGSF